MAIAIFEGAHVNALGTNFVCYTPARELRDNMLGGIHQTLTLLHVYCNTGHSCIAGRNANDKCSSNKAKEIKDAMPGGVHSTDR